MMKVLFIHQNFPGQFKHLARHMADDPGNQVVFITQQRKGRMRGVRKVLYKPKREPARETHQYLRTLEKGVLYGQGAVRAAQRLKHDGFVPDIVVAHPGWGEALYIKDVFPDTVLLNYFEWFYHAEGTDADFGDREPPGLDARARIRTRNALHLLNLETCDWGISPTYWQWSVHPAAYRPKISVIHDGVDTDKVAPREAATVTLPNGRRLTRADEVITYVSRNLEPYRGFPTFMHAVEEICRRRPNAQVLIVGADGVSYGSRLPDGQTYREKMLQEVSIDPERVHFLGRLPYDKFLMVLQVSSAHVYLTYPFVLSWSLMEAMAAGCLIIGSATPPVEEVVEEGRNGLLVDFFSPREVADRVDEVLEHGDRFAALRHAARETVIRRYDLRTHCLPRQARLMEALVGGGMAPEY